MHPDEAHYSAAPIGADEAAQALRYGPTGLAGQYAHYIAFELQMWRRGFRNSSPDSMAPIAKRLDDQQLAAVAAYYQQVRSSNGVATTK